jgi:squalene synthase HpnC
MNGAIPSNLTADYEACLRIAREHYENFPVVSLFVPKRLRPHVAAVYAFARGADDLADEGADRLEQRLSALADWRFSLERCIAGEGEGEVFRALGHTIRSYTIPPRFFHALIDAFEQDVVTQEYETFEQVLDYCRRSANPVGAIMLALFGCLDERSLPPSDALCTGLQLANFWQDVSVDARKPRCYIPREDLERFGLCFQDLADGSASSTMRELIRFEVQRTREYFVTATFLLPLVPWRLRMNLRAIRAGGMQILTSIEAINFDVTRRRPVLTKRQAISILFSSILPLERNGRS